MYLHVWFKLNVGKDLMIVWRIYKRYFVFYFVRWHLIYIFNVLHVIPYLGYRSTKHILHLYKYTNTQRDPTTPVVGYALIFWNTWNIFMAPVTFPLNKKYDPQGRTTETLFYIIWKSSVKLSTRIIIVNVLKNVDLYIGSCKICFPHVIIMVVLNYFLNTLVLFYKF